MNDLESLLLMTLLVTFTMLLVALFVLVYTKRELDKVRATNREISECVKNMSSKYAYVRCVIQDILEGK